MTEFGVSSYKQYTDGQSMIVVDGKQYRYKGTIPLSMSPWAAVNLGAVMLEIAQMCKSIPLDAPWEAKNAQTWDQISLAKWLSNHTLSKPAHALLETAIAGCYTSAASEVSMLFVVYQMASGGGPDFVLGGKDASQDSRPVGGIGAIYRPSPPRSAMRSPLAAGPPNRAGRGRGDGALRRDDGPGASCGCRGSNRDREPKHLRADASR